MIKTKHLLPALALLTIAALSLIGAGYRPAHEGLLQNLIETAQQRTAMSYYADRCGGYKASAATRIRQAFH